MKKVLFFAAVAAVMSLTSCGGDKDSATSGSASSEQTSAGSSDGGSSVTTESSQSSAIEKKAEKKDDSVIEVEDVIIPSELQGKVEVLNAKKFIDSKFSHYPTINVTFKLLETVNTAPFVDGHGRMWIGGIAQDENGDDVVALIPSAKCWRGNDSKGTKFKEFIEGNPGAELNIDFTGNNGSKEPDLNVSEELAKVKKFKLQLRKQL